MPLNTSTPHSSFHTCKDFLLFHLNFFDHFIIIVIIFFFNNYEFWLDKTSIVKVSLWVLGHCDGIYPNIWFCKQKKKKKAIEKIMTLLPNDSLFSALFIVSRTRRMLCNMSVIGNHGN